MVWCWDIRRKREIDKSILSPLKQILADIGTVRRSTVSSLIPEIIRGIIYATSSLQSVLSIRC
jgi:hypothetical protein